MRRLWLAGATALALAMSSSPAFGAVLWTLVGTPLTATTGQSTTFTLTATNENLLQDIRCIRASLGSQFAIEATSVVSVSNGGAWTASATATNVAVSTSSGGDRLRFLQSLRFTVLARPLSAGAFAWNATAYEQEDCSQSLGLSLQLDAIVVTGVAPTSAPTQMATPTPTPRPTPTPTPAPLVPLPSLPLPTLPLPTLSPSLPLPTLSPVLPTATPGSPIWGFLPTPSPSLQMAVPTAQPSGSQAPSSTAAGAGG
ncbi:MAG TPA: hypothetical protein VFM74_02055, partial [Candidatus Limnocylindria bacterium]|nr:hypothetical protein [Candidatus Limnocylindria bacterium]